MNNCLLSDFATFVTARIDVAKLSPQNYVGVDNLLPNRSGRVDSEYVPNEGSATAFIVGDVLIGNIRPYLKKIWLSDRNGGCSNDVLVIRSKGIIKPSFLYAILSTDQFFDYNMAGSKGTKMPRGDKEHIMRYPTMVPEYQEEIGAFLQAINERILLNKSICADLDALAKIIYDYWFVQFDFPDENGNPYRTSGGEMEWNEQLKKDIPAGWSASKIKSFCTVTSGYPFDSGSYLTTGHYKLITIKNVQDDGINLDVDNFIETLPSNLPEYCKLKDSDILMSLTGNVGRVGLMYDNSCLLNQRVAIINPSKEAIRSYIYFLFKSDSLRMTMERIATGTSQKNLSPVDTELLNIPYDSIVAEKYSTIVDSAMKEMVLRLKENCELIRLRDWLLPMLMNGQATVE